MWVYTEPLAGERMGDTRAKETLERRETLGGGGGITQSLQHRGEDGK